MTAWRPPLQASLQSVIHLADDIAYMGGGAEEAIRYIVSEEVYW